MKKKNTLLAFAICSIFLLNSKLTNAKCHIDDWTALKALYESTDGDNWTNNDGWEVVKSDEPPLDCDLETLYGVATMHYNRVTSLSLDKNNLSGYLPNELENLYFLEAIDVSNNNLSGNIPNLKVTAIDLFLFYIISLNYYDCSEIEKYDIPFDEDVYFGIYNYTPQKYNHDAVKNFLVNSSSESITLNAPFELQGNFTYQWYKNNLPIEGATDTILYLNSVKIEDVGDYRLHINDPDCIIEYPNNEFDNLVYISDPISVRRTDLKGCTDINACNYNQFAMIDDGSCEYLSCDKITNPIKIRTTNETILSDTQIKFDLVIDSLGLDYSADGLTFNLDTRRNYIFESVEVVNPTLSIVEVDISQLYNNTISIDRINSQRLGSNEPVISITACIASHDIPTEEETCSHFAISGGTELPSGHFISFDDIYIDIPFSNCSPYGGGYGVEGANWLPLVLAVSPQNCNLSKNGLIEIKILEEGQSPFTYILKNETGETVFEGSSNSKMIELNEISAGNYELTTQDANEKLTQRHICVPLIGQINGNEACNTTCTDYLIIPTGEITGNHTAKKEIEIRGYITGDETVEFNICD